MQFMETPVFPRAVFDYYFKDHVYEPAEDTFVLLDAIEQDLNLIRSIKPLICLEIGCGSGAVIAATAKALGKNCCYFATDINKYACQATIDCCLHNDVPDWVNVIQCDLSSAIENRLATSVDLLFFNPPYVVTPSEEIGEADLSFSWAGGANGREVIDKFLPLVPKLLSKHGLFYLIIIKDNNATEIEYIMKTMNFSMTKVLERRCGIERLSALRFQLSCK